MPFFWLCRRRRCHSEADLEQPEPRRELPVEDPNNSGYSRLKRSVINNHKLMKKLDREAFINRDLATRCHLLYSNIDSFNYFVTNEGKKSEIYKNAMQVVHFEDGYIAPSHRDYRPKLVSLVTRNSITKPRNNQLVRRTSLGLIDADSKPLDHLQTTTKKVDFVDRENLKIKMQLRIDREKNERLQTYLRELNAAYEYSERYCQEEPKSKGRKKD